MPITLYPAGAAPLASFYNSPPLGPCFGERLPASGVLLLGLVGENGSGRTTAADYLTDTYSFEPFDLAAPRQQMLEALFTELGIDYAYIYDHGKQYEPLSALHGLTARFLLEGLMQWGERSLPGLWRLAADACLGLPAFPVHDRIVISDIQHAADAAWLTAHGGVLVRINRPGPISLGIDFIETAYTLENDGPLERLFEQLDRLMDVLVPGRPGTAD